jgi:hypothetical protein
MVSGSESVEDRQLVHALSEHGGRNPLSVDHIVQRLHGGSDDPWNLRVLCLDCNKCRPHHNPADAPSTVAAPDDVRATRGSALRQALAGLWNRLNTVWKVLTVLAGLGIAVAFVLLLVALFRAEPERKLQVGDTAASGSFDFSFRKIACHKRRKDLPKPIEEIPFPIKGELCFADFRIRNSSDESRSFLLPTRGSSAGTWLHVGDEEYPAMFATPVLPATLFPDQEASLTFIFDIPHRVEPTALTLKDGQGDEEGDELEWEIR